jgi:beta-glucosidase
VPSGHEKDRANRHLRNPEIDHKVKIVEATTEAVGDRADVAFDCHWSFTGGSAKSLAEAIEEYDVWWLEDPVPPENHEVQELVTKSTTTPIAVGENVYQKHGQRTLLEPQAVDINAGVGAARDADVAVLALGKGWYLHEFGLEAQAGPETGRWPTRRDIHLPAAQRELVQLVHATGTPVVGVLVTGRPLIVDWMADDVPALLMAYFPGTEGGVAVAETLFGENDPSGRLPISVPRDEGDLPQHHDVLAHPTPIGKDEHPDSYDPLFPFGHGLSYTTFETRDLAATVNPEPAGNDGSDTMSEKTVHVSVEVANVGDRRGTETVQVYARLRYASRVRPVRSLVGFDRVDLDPGESESVEMRIPARRLGFYKPRDSHTVEAGTYEFEVAEESTAVEL